MAFLRRGRWDIANRIPGRVGEPNDSRTKENRCQGRIKDGASNHPMTLSWPIVSEEWCADRHFAHSDAPRIDHQGDCSDTHATPLTPRNRPLPGCPKAGSCLAPRSPATGEGHRDRRTVPGTI